MKPKTTKSWEKNFIEKYMAFCQKHFGMEKWPAKESYFYSMASEVWKKMVKPLLNKQVEELLDQLDGCSIDCELCGQATMSLIKEKLAKLKGDK